MTKFKTIAAATILPLVVGCASPESPEPSSQEAAATASPRTGVTIVSDDGLLTAHATLAHKQIANEYEIAGDGIDNNGNGFVDEDDATLTACSDDTSCGADSACADGYCRTVSDGLVPMITLSRGDSEISTACVAIAEVQAYWSSSYVVCPFWSGDNLLTVVLSVSDQGSEIGLVLDSGVADPFEDVIALVLGDQRDAALDELNSGGQPSLIAEVRERSLEDDPFALGDLIGSAVQVLVDDQHFLIGYVDYNLNANLDLFAHVDGEAAADTVTVSLLDNPMDLHSDLASPEVVLERASNAYASD